MSTALPDLAIATDAAPNSTPVAQDATITGSGTTGQATGAVSITGAGTSTTGGALTGLPKLSGVAQPVTPTVPPTANAPYMQPSSLPEGTVFIVVGAILGFMAISVLLWRALVAWSLHRSVKCASQHQTMTDTKAMFRAPGPPAAPFYKNYSDRDSTISLSGVGGKSGKKARPTPTQGNADRASLFFSPTAGAAGAGLGTGAGNRASSYLPAGYYASGTASAANGSSQVTLGGHQPAISLSHLRTDCQGYNRARSMGPSPPDSPHSAGASERQYLQSTSSLNLDQGYGGGDRRPSAYLDDLFDREGGGVLGGVEHGRAHSGSPRRY
ncbi:uncharacterized protein L3040_007801 [Drepanopeziza brunnea f. sp. 'multigermtubi']|uniref:Csi2 protein n=1 Tax=Marssonina brunnea f. sp. multigermtubi (strain MB_m1) TaxID=1072389 RepID=K1XU23_MARBU|nr:uncharacterized protein MBM_05403 [Drepanopeziza brunnea f. sp. 'multigermtubi' MB_m1]EKD16109.1 hypothetical protein MBM_05403 [Drepanopeziza brunnea f. sp. 'multigermtubi' MB_m1]KAJ5035326.1 hypothetical protein L3040_007801 [Drepanopeziza brunnea f. sp. 'multigermtubi']